MERPSLAQSLKPSSPQLPGPKAPPRSQPTSVLRSHTEESGRKMRCLRSAFTRGLCASSGACSLRKQPDMALEVQVAFYSLLRAGELLSLQTFQVQINPRQDNCCSQPCPRRNFSKKRNRGFRHPSCWPCVPCLGTMEAQCFLRGLPHSFVLQISKALSRRTRLPIITEVPS